jgi:RNA polymerase sigma-70 factor, ECF subfamily
VKIRRRAWQGREVPLEPEGWSVLAAGGSTAQEDVETAERLNTTRGALYKTIHDARRKLRGALAARGLSAAVDSEDI